ncbi:MAG TPA: hypothetical protein VF338_07555 [Leptolinea sp.]
MGNPTPLELDFHKEMLAIYRNAKEKCGYNATRFLQMISNNGGLKTAKKLLATSEPSDGFTVLWEHGRLDLTVENLVLNPKYSELFAAEEFATAKMRLKAYGFIANE